MDDIEQVASRHGFSVEAVAVMRDALERGLGMAQFNHREFGGAGQWMRGGMTMVGDMFNQSLKARVDALCSELVSLHGVAQPPLGTAVDFPPESTGWWPAGLGSPASAGGQNGMRYAYFPTTRRLAIDSDGQLSIYDTLDHRIGGVAQQQSATSSLTFTSQHGPVRLEELPLVGAGMPAGPA